MPSFAPLLGRSPGSITAYSREVGDWLANTLVPTQSSKKVSIGISVFFVFSWIYYSTHAFISHLALSPWTTGEWLINYGGGFQRRGALGTLTLALSDFTTLSPTFVTFGLQSLIAGVGLVMLFIFLTKTDAPLILCILIMGPLGFFYFLSDLAVVGRKEILLYVLMLLWLKYLAASSVKRIEAWKEFALFISFSVLLIFAILSHEGFLFFIPIFVWVTLAHEKAGLGGTANQRLQKISPFVISVLVSVPPILLSSSNAVGTGMCQALIDRGVGELICSGAINFAASVAAENLFFSTIWANLWPWLAAYVPVALILIFLTHMYSSRHLTQPEIPWLGGNTSSWLVGLFFITSPIFIVSVDWGRYLSMFFTLVSLAMLSLYLKRRNAAWGDVALKETKGKLNEDTKGSVRTLGVTFVTVYVLFFGVSHYGGAYQPIVFGFISQGRRAIEGLLGLIF